jgi:cytochrome c oxidase subunit 3
MLLNAIFTGIQDVEYSVPSFTISDGAFGTCFYFGTGFHGLHVIIGTAFLSVGLSYLLLYLFMNKNFYLKRFLLIKMEIGSK